MLWSPSKEFIEQANLSQYIKWLATNKNLLFQDYHELWNWSVEKPEVFWESLWQYFDILHDGDYHSVIEGKNGFNVSWFEGVNLNYAEHIFRNFTEKRPAIIFKTESGNTSEMTWGELRSKTASLQQHLKSWQISPGDRVVALLPCIPEATIALLATASLGAVWSSCSPDFGTSAILDRFAQTNPKILIATDRYNYGGKSYDKTAVVQELIKNLPTLEKIILISENPVNEYEGKSIFTWHSLTDDKDVPLQFVRMPFSHPLWILYSSGTTGLPKAFVHSHGGILMEQLKYGTFHNDFKPGERCFWYTTTGWMMWNYIHGSLLAGGTMVLYDGSVAYPDLNALWKFAADVGIHHFGTSAAYLLANMKEDVHPSKNFDLSVLRSISSTGSTLPPEAFH
ncbi:MAG TPA: AMP-binding protein, partial [Chryseolinea sp.]|nr:AMP-binding protein [Chryseolinea sp.]